MDERSLYRIRFGKTELATRQRLWRVLVDEWMSRWIDPAGTVLDLGASDCAFINNVTARRRIAVDINPDVEAAAGPGVEVVVGTLEDSGIEAECDVIMASNIFEHLPSIDVLLELLGTCHDALVPGGRLLILQPNFRYTTKQFYDYLDHSLPLTHKSLEEALAMVGLEVERSIRQFLPYSAKKRRITWNSALRAYLRIPVAWKIFGKQMFIVARRPQITT